MRSLYPKRSQASHTSREALLRIQKPPRDTRSLYPMRSLYLFLRILLLSYLLFEALFVSLSWYSSSWYFKYQEGIQSLCFLCTLSSILMCQMFQSLNLLFQNLILHGQIITLNPSFDTLPQYHCIKLYLRLDFPSHFNKYLRPVTPRRFLKFL